PQDFEDQIANWLCPLLAQHDVLLDLHSFNAESEPFVMMGPLDNDGPLQPFKHAQKERALARRLGVRRFVDGWLATYGAGVQRRMSDASQLQTVLRYGVGTTEYMRSTGGYALTLECGQHNDPAAPDVAYRAIMNTLAFLKVIEAPEPEPVAADQMEALSMVVVHDKMDKGDAFVRTWSSFDPVTKGQQIGVRADGTPVTSELDGRILFPDVNAGANQEWYYLTRANPDFARG
ncbi:MAG TPA: succinylglutamate desuccinylase, partial [Telluria sp.]|nr:succinylglutamate desuccinylase [Telluria sp.]